MSPMVCIECGRTYQNGEKFCARDDTPLVEVVLCEVCGASKRPGERTCMRCAEIELEKLARQRKATLLKILGAVAGITLLAGAFVGYRVTRPPHSEMTKVSNAVARSDDSARAVDVETGLPAGVPEETAEPAPAEPAPPPEADPPPAEPDAEPAAEAPDPASEISVPERAEPAKTEHPAPAEAPAPPAKTARLEPSQPSEPARPFFPIYVGERPGPSEEELSQRARMEPAPEPPRPRRTAVRKVSLKKRVVAEAQKQAPVRTASVGWVRDAALESELAGRGVYGVKVLRKDRALRLTGAVSDDMQLRSLYDYINQKGFGEVDYGVEVR